MNINKKILIISIFIIFVTFSVFSSEYDKIIEELNKIVQENPKYAQLMNIGKNDQGNLIYGIKVENPMYLIEKREKAAYLLVGTHHGDERKSADVCIVFAKKLINIFKNPNDKLYNKLSDNIFYIIPVLNISGYNANRRYEEDKYGNLVDPNRDYPDVCVHNTYFKLASIRNLATFVDKFNIIGAVTVHGYIGTFTYPWGIYTDNPKTLDNDFYEYVARESVKANGYRIGTHTEVIYPASGAFEDWAYYKYGIWTMLLELDYYPNLENDSQCLLIYFSLLPDERSTHHQHTGNCTARSVSNLKSRP